VKKVEEMGAASKIARKVQFSLSTFQIINYSIPQIFKNIIVVRNFIFFNLMVLDLKDKRESS